MIRVRKEHPTFGRGDFEWIDCQNDAIAAYTRTFEGEVVIVLNNLSTLEQNISISAPVGAKQVNDLLTKTTYHIQESTLNVKLNPRQYLWLA